MKLEDISIHAWIQEHQIKTESGQPLSFKDHLFLFQPYTDESPKQVILKAAQIGFSTLAILKSFWIAKTRGLDIIYTLPTEADVQIFAGGKINRLIGQNPVLQGWVKDKDRVEQKSVGDNIIYYRGTWSQKQAISHSSDLNIYDEVDSSKQDVIEQYSTRLQHSPYKWEWYFSHPSAEGTGVDRYWGRSDQKHWFIRCSGCGKEQYLSWPDSIDPQRRVFICKYCKGELRENDRRVGRWVAKHKNREFSGYWIPLLICPWVSAEEIIGYFNNKSEEYFWNKVLGLPYVGGGNKLTRTHLMQNLTDEIITPDRNERVVIGLDTGSQLHYVCGTEKGLFLYGETAAVHGIEYHTQGPDYSEIEAFMKRWPRAIVIVDQGGDLIGSRKLREKYPGRVFLCTYTGNDTSDNPKWGAKDEYGTVSAGRNKFIQLVVDEFSDRLIPLQGTENDWYDYFLHWNNLTRIKEIDEKTGSVKRKIWVRSGDDHWAHATVYWRIGISRFASEGVIATGSTKELPINGVELAPDDTMPAQIIKQMRVNKPHDWRRV
jgi:Phage terminase large subunit (GpA)